jgi:hypothetical protein
MTNYSNRQKILNTKKKWSSLIDLILKQQKQDRILKQNNPKIKNYEQLFYRY